MDWGLLQYTEKASLKYINRWMHVYSKLNPPNSGANCIAMKWAVLSDHKHLYRPFCFIIQYAWLLSTPTFSQQYMYNSAV